MKRWLLFRTKGFSILKHPTKQLPSQYFCYSRFTFWLYLPQIIFAHDQKVNMGMVIFPCGNIFSKLLLDSPGWIVEMTQYRLMAYFDWNAASYCQKLHLHFDTSTVYKFKSNIYFEPVHTWWLGFTAAITTEIMSMKWQSRLVSTWQEWKTMFCLSHWAEW